MGHPPAVGDAGRRVGVEVGDGHLQRGQQGPVADQEGAAAGRLPEQLVEVDGHRVGGLDPGQQAAVAVAEQQPAAPGGVDVQPQPPPPGPPGQGRQRVDAAEVGGAGGGHQGQRPLAGGLQPVEGPVQLVGAQAPLAVHRDRLDSPAAQPEHGRGPGHAEVGQLRAEDAEVAGVGAEPVGGHVAARAGGGGVAGQQQPHQVRLGAAAGHDPAGDLGSRPAGRPARPPAAPPGGWRAAPGPRSPATGWWPAASPAAATAAARGWHCRWAAQAGWPGSTPWRTARRPSWARAAASPTPSFGERLDPGGDRGQLVGAGPAVGPGPLPGRRFQAVAGGPQGVGRAPGEQPAAGRGHEGMPVLPGNELGWPKSAADHARPGGRCPVRAFAGLAADPDGDLEGVDDAAALRADLEGLQGPGVGGGGGGVKVSAPENGPRPGAPWAAVA